MVINFKNKHIYFALEPVWMDLHYKFKSQIHDLVTMNSDDEFVQAVEIAPDTLIQIYRVMSMQHQGMAKYINLEMQESLVTQLEPVANFIEMAQGEPANEAAQILIACQNIDSYSAGKLLQKIDTGKEQILA